MFIYCHLTSLLAWPRVHKDIPVRGFLLRRKRSRRAEEASAYASVGVCVLPVLGQGPFVSQGRSDVFGQVSSCLCYSASELLRNILFSTCISQIHLDRHKFEFFSPNADTALKFSINSSFVNSHTHQRNYLAVHKLWQSLELDCKAQRPQALAPVHTSARTSAKLLNSLFIRAPTLGAELPLKPSLTPKCILGAL